MFTNTDGEDKNFTYYSNSLSLPERNYYVTRREPLAVMETYKIINYLYGKFVKEKQIKRLPELTVEYHDGCFYGNIDGKLSNNRTNARYTSKANILKMDGFHSFPFSKRVGSTNNR